LTPAVRAAEINLTARQPVILQSVHQTPLSEFGTTNIGLFVNGDAVWLRKLRLVGRPDYLGDG
jgi:hypothetical protein